MTTLRTDVVPGRDDGRRPTAVAQLSLPRIYLMRVGYLIMAGGLAVVKWPAIVHHAQWTLMEGVVNCMLVALSVLAFLRRPTLTGGPPRPCRAVPTSSAGSLLSAASCGSVMSAASLGSIMSAATRGGVMGAEARATDATARTLVQAILIAGLTTVALRGLLGRRGVG